MSFITDLLGGDQPDFSQAEFKPYSVTTPFGSSNINRKKQKITANLSPELQALYDRYLSAATGLMPTQTQLDFGTQVSDASQGLFDQYLGRLNEALNYDVNKETQDYYDKSLAMLAPQREQENANLADTLFKMGRTGAAIGMDEGYINPEQYALLKARENANLGLFMTAQDRARAIRNENIDRATQGITGSLGLFGTGVNIAPTLFGSSQAVLGQAMNMPTSLGQQIGYGLQAGSASANAGANIAQMQQQQYQNNLGFWGGLLGGAGKAWNWGSK